MTGLRERDAAAAALATGEAFAALALLMADVDAQWSAGTFGAIAEFLRDAGEPAELHACDRQLSAATARGAVRVEAHAQIRLVAYETVSRHAGLWRHSIALCLPEAACAMHGRRVVTELGPDRQAAREKDRDAVLFDLGLGLLQTDACVRTADPQLIVALRASEGRALFDAGNSVLMDILRASPHRVFVTRVARVEVFQPIPAPEGKSPSGPHTHILPKLLRANRTHAATTPMPRGYVPCANVYPAHAMLDAEGLRVPFQKARLEAFNALLAKYGAPELVSVQREVARMLDAGASPGAFALPADKFARASLRVALRKLKAGGNASAALEAWMQAFDRSTEDDGEDEIQHAS